jgi:hypothetical protein
MHPVFVHLHTYDHHYLCAENQGGGEVNATRVVPHEWETFGVMTAHGPTIHSGDLCYITTIDEHSYLQAANGGGGVDATPDQIGPREVWTLQSADGQDVLGDGAKIHILGPDRQHYLCAENGGGGVVDCTRLVAAQWETFTLEVLGSKPLTWSSGDQVVGPGAYMATSVTLQQDGTLLVETRTECHKKLAGFTGGIVVVLLDEIGNVIANSPGKDYGVDGQWTGLPWTRTVREEYHLTSPADLWERTFQLGAFMAVDPHRRLEQDVKEAALEAKSLGDAFTSVKDIVDVIKQIFGAKSGTPPPS